MKKSLILGGALCLLGSVPAHAEVNLNVDLGLAQPSYYSEPGPAYVAAPAYPGYYRHRDFHHPERHDHDRDHRR